MRRSRNGLNHLLQACVNFDEDAAVLWLNDTCPVGRAALLNEPDAHGHTPLHYAAGNNMPELLRMLLAHPEVDCECQTLDLRLAGSWYACLFFKQLY